MSRRARAYRTPRLVAGLLAIVCTSACQATTVSGLNIRALPTTASRVVGTLGTSGTAVSIDCVVRGEAVHGDTTWYRISQPRTGYVTGYYVRTDGNIHDTTRTC